MKKQKININNLEYACTQFSTFQGRRKEEACWVQRACRWNGDEKRLSRLYAYVRRPLTVVREDNNITIYILCRLLKTIIIVLYNI